MLLQIFQQLLNWWCSNHTNDHINNSLPPIIMTDNTKPSNIIEFELCINPRHYYYKQAIDIANITIKEFLDNIFLRFPNLQADNVVLNFIVNRERFTPTSDNQLQQALQQFANGNIKRIIVIVGTPQLCFSSYTYERIAQLYDLIDDDNPLKSIPTFTCGTKSVDNNPLAREAFQKLLVEINTRLIGIPLESANEASKSAYTLSFLLLVISLFNKSLYISPEFRIQGPKGRGNVDFAIMSTAKRLVIGVTEIKKDDINQGIAQNMIQLDSALTTRKRQREDSKSDKIFGIVTNAEKWVFLQCTATDDTLPSFQISKQFQISYNNGNFQRQAKEIFGTIWWLFDSFQQREEGGSKKKKRCN